MESITLSLFEYLPVMYLGRLKLKFVMSVDLADDTSLSIVVKMVMLKF